MEFLDQAGSERFVLVRSRARRVIGSVTALFSTPSICLACFRASQIASMRGGTRVREESSMTYILGGVRSGVQVRQRVTGIGANGLIRSCDHTEIAPDDLCARWGAEQAGERTHSFKGGSGLVGNCRQLVNAAREGASLVLAPGTLRKAGQVEVFASRQSFSSRLPKWGGQGA